MKLQKNQKLLFIGDSITDCGRAQPAGEGLFDALGKGYVALVDALLGAAYPELSIRVVNQGNGGHNVRDLKARWERDVVNHKPDWVAVMIGINDVWRQFDLPKQPETHVLLDEYSRTLDELVTQTKPLVKGLVLMTPFYIEPNKRDGMRATMDRYGAAVKKLAAKHGTHAVDTQAAFDAVLKHYYPATLAWDRVHPTQTGHMVLARAFLNGVGFKR
ncbi:MAG: SGNH/GDSL hydrolase family protein [Planctomycetes bacterium]|nr:SGNH/GDSL hydrolase family protein [Planctomycetota bacterium]